MKNGFFFAPILLFILVPAIGFSSSAHADPSDVSVHHHARFTPEGVFWTTKVHFAPRVDGNHRVQINSAPSWHISTSPPDANIRIVKKRRVAWIQSNSPRFVFEVKQPPTFNVEPPLVLLNGIQSVTFSHTDDVFFVPTTGSGLEKRTLNVRSKKVSKREARRHKKKFSHSATAIFFRGSPYPRKFGVLQPREPHRKRALALALFAVFLLSTGGFFLYRKTTRIVELQRAEKILEDDLENFPV